MIIRKMLKIYGNIKKETLDSAINNTAYTALHLDNRDVSLRGKAFAAKPYSNLD